MLNELFILTKIKEAYSFDFQQIKKGNAEKLINQKLKEWFSPI